jgi:hypothetical protein
MRLSIKRKSEKKKKKKTETKHKIRGMGFSCLWRIKQFVEVWCSSCTVRVGQRGLL